jgi:YHS domain-containing protein
VNSYNGKSYHFSTQNKQPKEWNKPAAIYGSMQAKKDGVTMEKRRTT